MPAAAAKAKGGGDLSKFFIHRPIFAIVVSLIIVIAGAIAATQLPIAQYPQISPPTVQVSASYTGASPAFSSLSWNV